MYSALAELGADVEQPTDLYKEDGWIKVSVDSHTFLGVLEIKSTVSERFNVNGMRQLGEWVQRGIADRGINYKPIFIGASLIREPLTVRPNPFVHEVVKTAGHFGAVLLRAEDLFEALMASRRGTLDRIGFWKTMFLTVGGFDVRPFIK